MCECLLTEHETSVTSGLDEMPDGLVSEEACQFQVRTTYKLGLDPVDSTGFLPHAEAQDEVCTVWEEK